MSTGLDEFNQRELTLNEVAVRIIHEAIKYSYLRKSKSQNHRVELEKFIANVESKRLESSRLTINDALKMSIYYRELRRSEFCEPY